MPQRFLRPGITNSARWNSVGAMAGNLFVRLLTVVDDFGRTDGRTSVVMNCFAVWNECHPKHAVNLQQVAGMLQELIGAHLIDIYDVEDKRVLQIEQWQERIRQGVKERWPIRTELAASCSKLLPSSPLILAQKLEPSPAANRNGANGSRPTSFPNGITDSEWIERLCQDSTYAGIDVKREHGKMVNWCNANSKVPTRKRFTNWLNRADKPMSTEKPRQKFIEI